MQNSASSGNNDWLLPPHIKVTRTPWAYDNKIQIMKLIDTREPTIPNVDQRMEMLSGMLSDPYLSHQCDNIKAVMAMYETGARPDGEGWYFVGGKLYEKFPGSKEIPRGSAPFHEVRVVSYWLLSHTNCSIREIIIRWRMSLPRPSLVYAETTIVKARTGNA